MRDEFYSERRTAAANQRVKEKKYWLGKLSGYPVNSHFPYDYGKIPGNKRRMDMVTFGFSREELIRLKQLSNNSDVRLYMILVTLLTVLLGKYTGNTDIITASPIYKQETLTDIANKVVILRNSFNEDLTFKELLLEVRKTIVEAMKNYSYPIEILMKELNIPFAPDSDVSLFDTFILLESIHDKSYLEPVIGYINMIFLFVKNEETLECRVEYNSLLYKKTTVERIMGHFKNILHEVLFVNVDCPVFHTGLLTGEEKQCLLFDFNAEDAQYPKQKTIHGLFAEQVEKTPDQMALIGKSQIPNSKFQTNISITYKELNKKSDQLAHVLRQGGVKPGTIVALILERSVEMIIGMLGILKAGGAYLPIDIEYPKARYNYMLGDSGVRFLLTRNFIIEATGSREFPQFPQPNQPLDPHYPAYIIYTSGTTGKPKGVIIEHRNVVRLFFNDQFQFDFSSWDVWTMFHSQCFDFSVWEMYGALLFGGKLVIIPKMVAKDPGRYLQVLKDHSVTVLNQTPSAFYNLVREELLQESAKLCLRCVIFGGEALQPGRLEGWRKRYPHIKLINMFGITETTVHVTYKEIGQEEIQYNTSNIGKPIPTLSTYIFDEYQHLLPIGAPGELYVGGAGVARGYLNRPELTNEKFGKNPYKKGERLYRSGDLARIYDNGEMEYHGRIDHQVQLRGFRIELAEIENQLREHPHIDDAVVLKKSNEEGDDYLCGYVVSKEEVPVPEIREHLGRSLPDYMIPTYFVRLENIPLTANGKIDKKSLPIPRATSAGEYTAPRSETEKTVADIWAEVLGLEKVSIKDSYFNLGGDSIKSIKLLSRVNHQLQVNLKVVDLFTHETVEKLSGRIVRERSGYSHEEVKQVLTGIEELKNRVLSQHPLSANINDIYPMADIQKGMVFHSLKEQERAVYHDQMVHHLRCVDFDAQRFEKALALMVEKHPILRTSFNVSDFEEPLLLVQRQCPIDFRHEDITGLNQAEQEEYIRGFLREDRQNPFDISTAPLWRMRTFGLDKDHIVVAWVCHHAIIDGWSDASFKTELNNIYLELAADPGFTPLKLKSSYKDFIIDQMVHKRKKQTREYWKNELEDYKRFQFPGTADTDSQKLKMKYYQHDLGIPLLKDLQGAAAAYRTSLKHLCFAAYIYTMGMLSYDNDIVTGLVTNNRPVCEDGEKILGCFLNTVPVRLKIPANLKWADYIRLVEQKLKELANHDRLSLFEIAKIIGDEARDQNPIFDMLFNFIDFHVYEELKPANTGEKGQSEEKRFPFDGLTITNTLFNFDIDVTRGNFTASLVYAESLLEDETIPGLFGCFTAVLNRFVHEPERIASKEDLLSEEEKQTLLYTFNRTAVEYPRHSTIPELFAEIAENEPDTIALHGAMTAWMPGETGSVTYRELNRKSNQLAEVLREKGVGFDTIVGIMLEQSIDMIIGILAILKAGGAYLPINPEYPGERINYMLKDSNMGVLLTTSKLQVKVEVKENSRQPQQLPLPLINIDREFASSFEPHSSTSTSTCQVSQANLAYIIYTSGSTGRPKGVMVEHGNVARLVKNANFIDWHEGQRLLMTGSIVFDITTFEIWGSLLNGLALYLVSKYIIMDPGKLSEIVVKNRISILHLIPQLFFQILEHDAEIFAGLEYFLVGGDMVTPMPINRLRAKYPGLKIIHAYGPTENTTFSTTFRVNKEYKERLPIGKPISNSSVYILDQYGKLLPPGVVGELYVGGDGVARGYLNNPQLTAEKFDQNQKLLQGVQGAPWHGGPIRDGFVTEDVIDNSTFTCNLHLSPLAEKSPPGRRRQNLYKTGDLGRWLRDGNIEFLGRIDSQVKIRGQRIEIGEIESRLADYEDITGAAVVARDDQKGQKYLCAYFTSNKTTDVNKLRNYLLTSLPDYMIPRHFLQLEQIPLTPNGKVDRKAFPEPGINSNETYIPPGTEVEKMLVDICSEVLGVEKIGINDNFFEIGGDSIKAIQVAARLLKYRLKLDVRDLLTGTDIKELSQRVKRIDREIHQGIITGKVKLTPIQARFFENSSTNWHHFNHSLMLSREEGLDPVIVKDVFTRLVEHHDALRMVYEKKGETVVQYNRGLEGKTFDYEFIQLSNRENMENEIETQANRIQESIDLKHGPLLKLGHFRTPRGDYLLMVIHHLVVDGVSWRIILEDFEIGYRLRQKGQEIKFQDKTDSFKYWSDKLAEYSCGNKPIKELPYWRKIEEQQVLRLPRDHEIDTDKRKIKYVETLEMSLDKEETGKLLKEVNHAYNTEINDLLLTALGLAVAAWCGNREILINLEGHGREGIIQDVNIARTVGWFTAEYPVLLHMNRADDIDYTIKQVKETLRAVPHKGIGCGILKYLTPEEKKAGVKFERTAEIAFNYLGEFGGDETDKKGLLTLSGIPTGTAESPGTEAPYAIQVNGLTRKGILGFSFSYNKLEYNRDSMEKLVKEYKTKLLDIIHHCLNKEERELTPSDYGRSDMEIEVLDYFEKEMSEMV